MIWDQASRTVTCLACGASDAPRAGAPGSASELRDDERRLSERRLSERRRRPQATLSPLRTLRAWLTGGSQSR